MEESNLIAGYQREAHPLESTEQKRKRNSSPLSYVAVIARTILSSPRQRLPLCEIYKSIEENYPEFTENRARWKNTVRHNLSLHDCFIRGEVSFNKKGCNWSIHPSFMAEFNRGDFSRHKLSQLPCFSLESGYATSHGAHFAVNPVSQCCICESARHVPLSPGLLQFQRQGIQNPPVPQFQWRPWIY